MEIVMLTTAGAIRMDGSRSDERRSRQVASQSVRRDLSAFDKPWSGQDRVPPYDHKGGRPSWRAPGSHSTSSRLSIISFPAAIEIAA
jgi:hypothetical protein